MLNQDADRGELCLRLSKTYCLIQSPVSFLDKLQVEIWVSPIIKVLSVSKIIL